MRRRAGIWFWVAIVSLVLVGCNRPNIPDGTGILLVPVGQVDPADLTDLQAGLQKVFGVGVILAPAVPEPSYAFDRNRKQYSSSRVVERISRVYGAWKGVVLAVTNVDLFVPELNFVFGEAQGPAAVVSLVRFHQSFYGFPERREIYLKRMLTEAVHELGHTYGLEHCPAPLCVMFFSNRIEDTDLKGYRFCSVCKRKLTEVLPKEAASSAKAGAGKK